MLIIQWNANSLYSRLENLKILIHKWSPDILCIQETNLKKNKTMKIKGYTLYYKNRNQNDFASGGVATYVKETIVSKQKTVNTSLEALVVEIMTPHKIQICNIYYPNSQELSTQNLSNLINQMSNTNIIVGDFNGHNYIWGSRKTDRRGKKIENLIDHHELVLLNDGSATHFCVASGKSSSIDLSLATSNIADKIAWSADEHTYDSDHHPIYIEIEETSVENTTKTEPKWIYKQANWMDFSDYINNNLDKLEKPNNYNKTVNELTEDFTTLIKAATDLSIPKTKRNTKKENYHGEMKSAKKHTKK